MQRPNRFILAAGIGLLLFNAFPAAVSAGRHNRFSEKRKIRIKGSGFRTVGGPYVNVVDWNGDGIDDLVMGQYAAAAAVYLRRNDGSFEDVKWIQVNGRTKVFSYARIAVTDWNDDGKLDSLVSNGGKPFVELYLNTGTRTEPRFNDSDIPGFGAFKQGSHLTLASGKPLSVERPYGRSVADWNADGTKDVIVGNSRGEVWRFLNKGKKGRPSLAPPVPISARGNTFLGDRDRATPSAADWNGDGKMDLLVTDYPGRIHLYLNKGSSAKATLIAISPHTIERGETDGG